MIDFFSKYFNRHYDFGHVFENEAQLPADSEKRSSRTKHALLFLLRMVPWICTIVLIVSILYDFTDEHFVYIFDYKVSFKGILKMVSISGLIGFSTNWIAIHMLFKPKERRPIWGQGFIPANRTKMIDKMAVGINKHILDEQHIKERLLSSGLIRSINTALIDGSVDLLSDDEFQAELKRIMHSSLMEYFSDPVKREPIVLELSEKIHKSAPQGIGGTVLKGYLKMNKKNVNGMLDGIIQSLPDELDKLIEKNGELVQSFILSIKNSKGKSESLLTQLIINIIDRINIYQILKSQLDTFEEGKLEEMIWSASDDQLMYIEYLGGLLGILGGLVIWQPALMLSLYAVLALLLFSLDVSLYQLKKKSVAGE